MGTKAEKYHIWSSVTFISLLAKIFSELAQGCARLYNRNKTKSCKCDKPCPNFDKFDFMALKKLLQVLQVYTSWQKYAIRCGYVWY
jgi:hypothetical protein